MTADPMGSAAEAVVAAPEDAVTTLYADRYYRLVMYIRMLNGTDRYEAEDVAQEAFLSYWRHVRDNPETVQEPFPWLVTVARRTWINAYRRRKANWVLYEGFFEEPVEIRDRTSTEGAAEVHDLLAGAARHYPDGARYVFLTDAGYTAAEIADMYGTTSRNVAYEISKVRAHVRGELLPEPGHSEPPDTPARPDKLPTGGRDVASLARRLPTKQRKVLQLAIDGLPPRKIAQVTGTTPGAVRANLHLAKTKIADALQVRREDVLPFLRQVRQATQANA